MRDPRWRHPCADPEVCAREFVQVWDEREPAPTPAQMLADALCLALSILLGFAALTFARPVLAALWEILK